MERFKSKVGQNAVLYHSLQILESFQFMSQSSDSLAKAVDKSDFKLLGAGFPNIGDNLFENLTKKGFFPYNYLDSFEKFDERFPPLGPLWYNNLTKTIEVTKKQHYFALGVYNAFKCENLDCLYASLQVGSSSILFFTQPELGCNAHYYWREIGIISRH